MKIKYCREELPLLLALKAKQPINNNKMEFLQWSWSNDCIISLLREALKRTGLKQKKIELLSGHANMQSLPAMHAHAARRCVSRLVGRGSRTFGNSRRPGYLVSKEIS